MLSKAARFLHGLAGSLRGLGLEWDAVSGPWEWSLQGKRLDELRGEIEEKSD